MERSGDKGGNPDDLSLGTGRQKGRQEDRFGYRSGRRSTGRKAKVKTESKQQVDSMAGRELGR